MTTQAALGHEGFAACRLTSSSAPPWRADTWARAGDVTWNKLLPVAQGRAPIASVRTWSGGTRTTFVLAVWPIYRL